MLHYIHEMNHALWAHLGLSASQAKVMASLPRQEFIEAMIREEAIGQSKAIRAKFDLMRVGDFTATAALEEEYLEAAAAVYRRERLRMPEDELRREMEPPASSPSSRPSSTAAPPPATWALTTSSTTAAPGTPLRNQEVTRPQDPRRPHRPRSPQPEFRSERRASP